MGGIIEPSDQAYESEWRLSFEAKNPAGHHVVFSGNVNVAQTLNGTSDDNFEEYTLHLLVGPWWRAVNEVVPQVHFSGFQNTDSDEDDQQAWWITGLTWDAVSGPPGPHVNEERIRLKCTVGVKGENSQPLGITYYVAARGRELGAGGLNSPGPVHKQGV